MIIKAIERKNENKAWDMYVVKYQHMDEKTYIPFEEFYNPKIKENTEKTEEEILNEVKDTLENYRGRWTT